MRLLLFLILFSNLATAFSQVRIVRDPLACAYGLKDEKNKWIVPAKYNQLVLLEKDIYSCQLGEKWGLLHANGNSLLPPRYNQISVFSRGLFLVTSQIKHDNYTAPNVGLIDSNGKWILPQEFNGIHRMQNEHYLLIKSLENKSGTLEYQSSISNTKGELLFAYIDGVILNSFYLKPVLLVGNNTIGSNTLSGNVRFIDTLGRVVSDSLFDMGMPCGENFVVMKNGRCGLVNAEGKTIIPTIYLFDRAYYDYQNPLYCLHTTHQFIFTENGKKGILNGDWQQIVPAKYHRINPINTVASLHTNARYIGYDEVKNRYHLIDVNGKILFEADTLITRIIPIVKSDYYENQKYKVFFIFSEKTNNSHRWGVLDHLGKILVPAENSNLFINEDFEAIMIDENKQREIPFVYAIDLKSNNVSNKTKLAFIEKIDSLYLFENNGIMYPLNYSVHNNTWGQSIYGANHPKKFGVFTVMISMNAAFIINNKTKVVEKAKHIDIHAGQFATVQTQEGYNLLHPINGKLFAKTMLQVNQQYSSINRIWAKEGNGKWKIYDTLGKPRLQTEFDEVSSHWETMIVQSGFKKGLLDNECTWKLQPTFRDLFPITSQLYVGVTFGGQVAVVDLDHSEKIDSSFHAFHPLLYKHDKKTFCYSLENNEGSSIFNASGGPLEIKEKTLLTQYWMEAGYDGPLILQYDPEDKGSIQARSDFIYEYYYPYYLKNKQQHFHTVTGGQRNTGRWNPYQFKVEHINDRSISLTVHQINNHRETIDENEKGNRGYGVRYENFVAANWIMKNDRWKKVEFEDLFQSDDSAFREIILEALEHADELKINCNEPESLFNGAKQFTFHKNGVTLYFFEGQSKAFHLQLNKAQLQRISSAKWLLNYL